MIVPSEEPSVNKLEPALRKKRPKENHVRNQRNVDEDRSSGTFVLYSADEEEDILRIDGQLPPKKDSAPPLNVPNCDPSSPEKVASAPPFPDPAQQQGQVEASTSEHSVKLTASEVINNADQTGKFASDLHTQQIQEVDE